MFGYSKLHQRFSLSTPILALVVAFVGLLIVMGFSLMRTATEANSVDSERVSHAVTNAVRNTVTQLSALSDDNAYWDDAAGGIYAEHAQMHVFAERTWRDTTAGDRAYDHIFGVDTDHQTLFGFISGAEAHGAITQYLGADSLRIVAAVTRTTPTRSGIIRTPDGLRIVAAAYVRPTSDNSVAVQAATQPRYIVMSSPLSRADLAAMGRDLVIGDLRHLDAPGPQSVPINDYFGRPIGYLAWNAALPGDLALARAGPMVAMATFAALLTLLILIGRSSDAVQELNRVAMLDSLSELPNRRALRRAMRRSTRNGTPMALAFIDLDGFKGVNDSFGHAVGDALICECARLATRIMPPGGMVARIGGDEFAILARGADADADINACSVALLDHMRQPFHVGERTMAIGASIGLAGTSAGCTDVNELMRQADIAMYAAKRSGKMCSRWFSTDLDHQRVVAQDIELGLRNALERDEFHVHYQPIIHAKTGRIVAVEALLRWNPPGRPAIGPDAFIPIAEETGLIDQLGRFVLRRAMMDAQQWGTTTLSVNVSVAQLRNPTFPTLLADILHETGFPVERLALEITETYIVYDPATARDVLDAIQALGVRLAIDDFGSGYASIGFLRQFTFNTVKLDRSLVADATTDKGAHAMVFASVAMARALGMTIVAEGIENEAQALFMRSAGADYLQGWLYASAIDADGMTAYLEAPVTLAQANQRAQAAQPLQALTQRRG